MIPRAIVHRQKSAAGLKAALNVHRTEAAEGVARQLEQETGPDLPLPDLEGFQLLLRKRLERARRELLAADELHHERKLRLRSLRHDRTEIQKDLRRLVHRLRLGVEAVYGVGSSGRILGHHGPTPRDPVVLSRAVKRILRQLPQGPPPHLEALPGTHLDAAAWIPLLEEPLARLEFVLHRIAHQKQEVVSALVAKNRAQAEYDHLEGTTRRMLRELYRYAGMEDVAESLHPRRRRGRSAEEVEEPALEEPETEEPETEEPRTEEESRPRLVLVPAAGDGSATPLPGIPPRVDGANRRAREPARDESGGTLLSLFEPATVT